MKVFFHFSVAGFSNTYLIGGEHGGGAMIVDPGGMNVRLLRLIEDNGYSIQSVLLTHTHSSHVKGLKTILKIYDPEIYARADEVLGFPCERVEDETVINLSGIEVAPMLLAGHSMDSVVYRIDRMLFTGDVMSAGRIGSTPNVYARALLVDTIKDRLCTLEGDFLLFPGHGAPSTLEVERRINPSLS